MSKQNQPYLSSKQVIRGGFGIVITLLVILIVVAVTRLATMQDTMETIANETHIRSKAVSNMVSIAHEHLLTLQAMYFMKDPFDRSDALDKYEEQATRFFQARELFFSNHPTKRELQVWGSLRELFIEGTAYHQSVIAILSSPTAGEAEFESAAQIILENTIHNDEAITKVLNSMLAIQQGLLEQQLSQAEDHYRNTITYLVLLGVLAIAISLTTTRHVARRSQAVEQHLYKEKNIAEEAADDLAWDATHDPLTQVANRRLFERSVENIVADVSDTKHALAYIDLDNFKPINDQHGHDAGDAMLQAVSKLMSQHIRKDDLLARIGGDEFGIIFYDCDLEVAQRTIITIREKVNAFLLDWKGHVLNVGMSAGVVAADRSLDTNTLIKQADTACYVDKANNKIAI